MCFALRHIWGDLPHPPLPPPSTFMPISGSAKLQSSVAGVSTAFLTTARGKTNAPLALNQIHLWM